MSTLPPEVAEAFTTAAITALQELLQVEISVANEANQVGPAVIATIRLLRDPPGSMSLVVPIQTASNLAARYLPAGTALTAEMINDVAGEFANVISGQAKTLLKGTAYHFNLTTPSVVCADSLRCGPSSVIIPFSSAIGPLFLQVELGNS